MGIKHSHQTALPDDPGSDVSSDEWNADHDIDDAAAVRALLELEVGTDVQAQSSELDLLAALTSTAFGRALLELANAAAARAALDLEPGTDVQAQDADLTALAGLVSAADRLPYYTGAAAAALAVFTAAGRALVDDADASAQRTTLGLGALAVLSSLAHSATTGQTANDHHTENHASRHGSAGADAVKLGNTYIPAGAMGAAITNGATGPTQIERPTNAQNLIVLDFPDAATKYAQFSHDMPSDYNGGTFTVEFEWTNANANTQIVRWQVEARAYADGDTIDQAWGTAQAVDDANVATAYTFRRSAATSAVTPAGSPAGGCRMLFRVARLGSHANDTLASDARLLGARIVYTRT